MFERTADLVLNVESVPSQTLLTNPSKLRIYPCKTPTVITETLIMWSSVWAVSFYTGSIIVKFIPTPTYLTACEHDMNLIAVQLSI